MGVLSTLLIVGVGMIIIGYIYMYIATRTYLKEPYQQAACSKETTIPVEQAPEQPYTVEPIRNLTDYEYAAVFENEAPRELSSQLRNKLMSQYPMDWSTNPPSSTTFQEGLREMFEDSGAGTQGQANSTKSPYTAIQDDSLQPPDTASIESEERKLLQTYQPKTADDLSTYNIDSAEELIRKIYDAKGEIPQVVKKDNNVYEIIGVRKKDEKIVYEETDESGIADTASYQGENVIQPPQAAEDKNAALDPFYEAGTSSRQGRWNYRQWTPGLERMFPPTEPRTNWY